MALTDQQKRLLYSFASEDAAHGIYDDEKAAVSALFVTSETLIEAEEYYDLIWRARHSGKIE